MGGSHSFDADYARVLPEFLRLKIDIIVSEMANPRHEGVAFILKDYLEAHEWPKGLTRAAGVIDFKTPIVETRETVAARLGRLAEIYKLGPTAILGGTDRGFETLANMGSVTRLMGLHRPQAPADGAFLALKRVGAP